MFTRYQHQATGAIAPFLMQSLMGETPKTALHRYCANALFDWFCTGTGFGQANLDQQSAESFWLVIIIAYPINVKFRN
ncbi:MULTISPECIES: hypothetical protein [unclassified Moorena]|uniref:Uncharacterized protein n=1 Tax=Moorena producens 3L TaxID=489825 RepID=F4XPC8_9CYAN|nr:MULTISPECIES: hypothetical protein [unclassified Moorena]EGJ33556.1 hypothetical protein LYNGBM3L_29210 [Moorena producens 3L]NEP65049.1 hypothetical protein [Moorena sp. SIO3A5]NEQ13096.1 hypothetical protein [Moorena sp. SIO3E2]NEP30112.1 hypothetical protein [Moorena sp. SIO3B2]NEQ06719.1 hypothetical protein [Moorena sp. SIO4E2]